MVTYRFYLYISDVKVDMLLAQLAPSAAATRTTEVGVDLKFVNGRRTVETSSDAAPVSRLERVLERLDKQDAVGTVEEPGPFFRGRLPMRWGAPARGDDTSQVFFAGRTARTVVALGGSTRHVLGSTDDTANGAPLSRSMLPSLMDGLRLDPRIAALLTATDPAPPGAPDGPALRAVREAADGMRGPAQTLEFVAKRLLRGTDPESGETVLLGSPLYVALAD
ncbi:SAVMC3_10250 family protein [Streptomyces sp. R02]|uniref:SAVMC3_10250 family protein n=1 Tax=Streptomyces sp. R02 TaxID=3238623 RepID=A0AB39LF67_9ACTN